MRFPRIFHPWLPFGALVLFATSPVVAKTDSPKPTRVVTYKAIGETELKLHIFEAENLKTSNNRTAIVFFFGGGWNGGTPKQFYAQSQALSKLGIVAFCADYRVRSRHKTTPFECVKDGKSAVRWIRENAQELGIDPQKIIASGGSAGGHVAACTDVIEGFEEEGENLEISSRPNATILFNPVLDTTERGLGSDRFAEDQQTTLSPCHHVSEGLAPTIIFHGTKDTTTPYENSERFTGLMKKDGNNAKLVGYPGKRHGFFNSTTFRPKNDAADYLSTLELTITFLNELGFLEDQ